MREDPKNPGKGQGHCFVVRRKFTSYNWVWCTVWLTGNRLQSFAGSVPCMRRWFDVMDPAAIFTQHSGHGIRLWSITQYESPTPVHFNVMASSDTPVRNCLGWHLIVHKFVTLAARQYLLNRMNMTFIACCRQSKPREPTMALLA